MQVKQGTPLDHVLTALFWLMLIASVVVVPASVVGAIVTGEWRWLLLAAAGAIYVKLVIG